MTRTQPTLRTIRGRRTAVAMAIALIAGLSACGSDADSSADTATGGTDASTGGSSVASDDLRQAVVTSLTNDVMVPAYQRMADDAAAMQERIEDACATPDDPASLTAAEEAWSAARTSWLLTRAFRFGPATTLRTMSTIDFPIDPDKIAGLVTAAEPITDTSLAALGADQRGLGGIELVLFGDGGLDPQACSYLVAASALVAEASDGVLAGWVTGIDGERPFADQLTQPGQGGMYANENEALADLVNSMIFAIADVADARIGRASGDVTGTPVPEEIDAGLARRARQDAIDVITGVQVLYTGSSAAAPGAAGIGDIVASVSATTDATMDEDLTTALAALDALSDPIADAADPAPAHAAYEALKAAQVTLRAEIASQLGVTLTFGDADGDS